MRRDLPTTKSTDSHSSLLIRIYLLKMTDIGHQKKKGVGTKGEGRVLVRGGVGLSISSFDRYEKVTTEFKLGSTESPPRSGLYKIFLYTVVK